MSRLLLLLVPALVLLPASLAGAADAEVYVRGTQDGLTVRVPDADLADCEILRPLPTRVILIIRDLALRSVAPRDRFSLARSFRVVGPDVLGGTESRIIIELTTSLLEPRLEEVGSGVILHLRAPEPPPPEPVAIEPVAELVEAPRRITTPWRRAREQAQAARSGGVEPADHEVDPADLERERRHAEDVERRRAREERERRVAGRDEPAPMQDPAPPAPRPREEVPEFQAPPLRERAPRGLQPSPATPVAAGMVRVAGGAFLMGSPSGDGFVDEEPQHPVDLDPFWIDVHEVSIGDFRHSPIRLPEQPEWNVSDDRPVVNVTWHEAAQYCDWAGKRLPTEAEWEKAARGEHGSRYPWGDGWAPDFANTGVAGDGHEGTSPVGAYPDGASVWGALDMAGNAWEWTGDWYDIDAYERRNRINPEGPSRGAHKVARGGSFRGMYSVNVRSAIRLPLSPSSRRDDVGFRCVADPR